MMRICWRVTAGDADIASVRYRCLIPIRHLAPLAVDSRLSWGGDDPLRHAPDALVLVKTFSPTDVRHAARAAARDIPVLVDVCDNVFAQGYAGNAAEQLRALAPHAHTIVTTGPALEQVLRLEFDGAAREIGVIPDPLETEDEAATAARTMWRSRLRAAPRGGLAELTATTGYGVRRALRRLRRASAPEHGRPQVLWFGNAGSTRPRYGVVNLVDIADELRAAATETPFRLVVVTSDRTAFARTIDPLGLEAGFVPWDGRTLFRHLRDSDVVVLPNSRDDFSVCKSANRAVLALGHGVPVVATRVPALDPFEDCALFDDFRTGVSAYLQDRELAARHVAAARDIIAREFAGPAIARRWLELIETAT
jgi:glycosyltransferase involved in cell wall biosynthesis